MLVDRLYGVLLVLVMVLLGVWKVSIDSIGLKIFFWVMWCVLDILVKIVGVN